MSRGIQRKSTFSLFAADPRSHSSDEGSSNLICATTPIKEDEELEDDDDGNQEEISNPIPSHRSKSKLSIKQNKPISHSPSASHRLTTRGVSFFKPPTSEEIEPQSSETKIEQKKVKQKTLSKAAALKKLMEKCQFKSDSIAEKALRILIYKKRDQRNSEDLAILQKATCEMTFFSELLAKKSNIVNNVHLNLCKAMNYEYVKKGSIVFYAGDIPDRFYILLKGEVSVLIKKKPEEIDKLKKMCPALAPSEQGSSNSEDKKKSKFTVRRYLLFKRFQAKVNQLFLVIRFIGIISTSYNQQKRSSYTKSKASFLKSTLTLNFLNSRKEIEQIESKVNIEGTHQNLENPTLGTINEEEEAAKRKRIEQEKVKLKKKATITYNRTANNSLDTKPKPMVQNLLPSEIVLLERKKQKQNNNNSAKETSIISYFKIPKMSSSKTPSKSSNEQEQIPTDTLKNPNEQIPPQSEPKTEKNEAMNSSMLRSTIQTKQNEPQPRLSLTARKLKMDLEKVRLGVRLSRVFKPDTLNNLNLGSAKLAGTLTNVKEAFKKDFPQLQDLLQLENAGHFFEDNVFKYFHAANLGEGRVFGDLGILTKKPRAATIICLQDCYFGVLGVEDYSRILMEQKKKKMAKAIKFLESTLDTSLSLEKMSKILYFFEKKSFVAGERIYDEGDTVNCIYLIKRGEVELFRRIQTEYGINATQNITVSIGIIGPKTYFGEDDALHNRDRKYTAVARVDSHVLVMKKKDFSKIVSEISEMNAVLREMVTKKEARRDETYNEIINTRYSIKNIHSLSNQKKHRRHKETTSDSFSRSSFKSHSSSPQHSSHSPQQSSLDHSGGEEQVKNQIFKMEAESLLAQQTRQKLLPKTDEIIETTPSIPLLSSPIPRRILSAKTQKSTPRNLQINFETSPSTAIEGKSPRILPAQSSPTHSPFEPISPRIQSILQDNPEFLAKVNMKELNSIIKMKKNILSHSLQGKEISAIEAFRETRDVCMGENDIQRKLEKVASRRNQIFRMENPQSDQQNKSQKRSSSKDMMVGKVSSEAHLETMLNILKKKHSDSSYSFLSNIQNTPEIYSSTLGSPTATPATPHQKALSTFFGVSLKNSSTSHLQRTPQNLSSQSFENSSFIFGQNPQSKKLNSDIKPPLFSKPSSMFFTPNLRMNPNPTTPQIQAKTPTAFSQEFSDQSLKISFGGLLGSRFSLSKDKSYQSYSRFTQNGPLFESGTQTPIQSNKRKDTSYNDFSAPSPS